MSRRPRSHRRARHRLHCAARGSTVCTRLETVATARRGESVESLGGLPTLVEHPLARRTREPLSHVDLLGWAPGTIPDALGEPSAQANGVTYTKAHQVAALENSPPRSKSTPRNTGGKGNWGEDPITKEGQRPGKLGSRYRSLRVFPDSACMALIQERLGSNGALPKTVQALRQEP